MLLDDFANRFQWRDEKRPPDSPLAAMKPCHELDRLYIAHPVWDAWLQSESRNLPFLEPDSPMVLSLMIMAMALYAMPNTTRKHRQHGNITMLDFGSRGRALAPSMLLAPDPDLERHLVCTGQPEPHQDLAMASAIAAIPTVTDLGSLTGLPLQDHGRVSALVLQNVEQAPKELASILVQIMPIMTFNGRILLSGDTDTVTQWQSDIAAAGGTIDCRARFDWLDNTGQHRSFALYTPFAPPIHRQDASAQGTGDIWRAILFGDLLPSEKTVLAPAMTFDTHMPMIMRGGPDPIDWTPPTSMTIPPLELARFTNATLFGYGMVTTEDGRLFTANMRTQQQETVKQDWQASDIGPYLWHNKLTPVAPGHYHIRCNLDDAETVETPAFLIGFQSGSDYTHFFWDVLPRLHLLAACPDPAPLIVLTGQASGWQQEILAQLEIPAARIMYQGPDDPPRRFTHLWVPSFLGSCNHALRPEGFTLLQDLKKRILAESGRAPGNLPKRLFLTRKKEKGWVRRHLNERAIEAQLANHGFVPVDTAELSLTEKAQLFDQAEMLAGSYGGAWAHAFFCRPGTKLMPFNTVDYPAPGGAVLAEALGMICETVMGETLRTELDPSNSPFLIDPSAIDLALQKLSA